MGKFNIQMVDLGQQYFNIKYEIDTAIQNVINNTSFINGPEVKDFAKALEEYNKVTRAITCGNGTDALQISMMCLGLMPGDEVILPAHTYVATAEVINLLNLKPVFVDVDYNTFNIDVLQIEKNITKKTKAIVPVHLYGQCADMESIIDMANKYGIYVIEDTAQAFGAEYTFSDGIFKNAGTMGNIGCLSFFPSKNLGCYGDGGAMLFSDSDLSEKARIIANHGQSIKYHHDLIGCNSRLDTIQAAILNVKLRHINEYTLKRQSVALKYNDSFKDIEEILIPEVIQNSTHVYHQYTIKIKNADRDDFRNRLLSRGIPSMIYYPIPLHLQKAYKSSEFPEGSLPITEQLSKEVLSLPIHTEMDIEPQAFIIDSIFEIIKEIDK